MATMAREFRFADTPDKAKAYTVPSSKMYKSRIKKWGFDKKYVRSTGGQHGGIRRATQPRQSATIPTPNSLSSTPPPINTHVFPLSIRSSNMPVSSRNCLPAEENQEGDPKIRNLSCGRPQRSPALTQISMYGSSISQDLVQTGHLQSRLCWPPSPLPESRTPEQIFGLIHSYVSGSFGNRKWLMIANEVCMAKDPTGYPVSQIFYMEVCGAAIRLFNQNSHAQAQRKLSRACGMIAKLLKREEPQSMRFLWDSLAILIQNRLVDVALMLRKFICEMASIILTPAHPWARMWKLLSKTEPDQLESLIHQAWQCATDAFAGATGRFNRTTISYQTNLIHRIYGVRDPASAVRRLRSLLQECERQCGTSNFSYLGILATFGYILLDQEKFEQAETTSNHLYEHAKATPQHESLKYQISAMEVAARAHYGLGQLFRAEGGLREATNMIKRRWGKADPWAINLMTVLEKWLREWNRREDADRLNREIAELSLE